MYEAGVSGDEAARTIDMTDPVDRFPRIDGPGAHPHAVLRRYEPLKERGR